MEKLPGPILYELLKFCGVDTIAVLELFSRSIQAKLRGSLSAFQRTLEKTYGINRRNFEENKQFLADIYKCEPADL